MSVERIKKIARWLVELEPGTVWTEYHWREALQLEKDLEELSFRPEKELETLAKRR